MKKAFKWFDSEGVSYQFHDYKKGAFNESVFQQAVKEHGWETVINKRGTTWRKLSDDVKANMNEANALKAAQDNPSIIKRPLIRAGNKTYLGFNADKYRKAFK